MKKLLTILLAVVICLSACSMAAFAVDPNVTMEVGTATASRGDTVEIPVKLTKNDGLVILGFELGYDSSILEVVYDPESENPFGKADLLTGANYGADSETPTKNPYYMSWAYGLAKKNSTFTGTVATFKFKIKDNAAMGASNITLTIKESSKQDGTKNVYEVTKQGSVTVACKSHVEGEKKVTKAATCTEAGVTTTYCSVCGAAMKTEALPAAKGHDWGEWTESKAATCTTKGEESRVCKTDATHTETRATDALGHKWGEWTETTAPTCTVKGVETRVCQSDATHTETRATDALGHKWGEWTETTAPTCTVKGVETRVCQNDATHTETRAVDALGHTWGEWNVTTAATCTADGVETRVCQNDATHTETRAIKATGHNVTEWTVTTPATLTEKGIRTGTCPACNQPVTEEIPMLLKELTAAEGSTLDFTLNATGDGTFSGYTFAGADDLETDKKTIGDKDVVGAYEISVLDTDTMALADENANVALKLKLTDDMKAKYNNFGVALKGQLIEATEEDGYLTFTAKIGDLSELYIVGTKIVVPGSGTGSTGGSGDAGTTGSDVSGNGDKSPETGESAAAALAVVLMAIAASFVVVSKKKARA